uniref:Glycosyltransferase 2-like domain-containing protein n=1 Tax=viral metagenome TaxID=1070528 RepID=A0A6C0KEC9_9ZZZZ
MGKKKEKKVSIVGKPFVSVCTPTYNRRYFIPSLIKAFKQQTYPKQLMEWIIIDDGKDSVEDLFKDVECVKYFRYEEKMKLGKKRNVMHEKCKGEIIVYMDDDDYYPPDRVNEAVNKLRSSFEVLAAGSSRLHIYFKDLKKIYAFGPYGPRHATAGTFAFKKKLLLQTCYDDEAEVAEEKKFLKDYTIPFIQLDSYKSILVFSHDYNTFDKKKLLVNAHPTYVRETNLTPKRFIKDKELLNFYMTS